MAERPSPFEFHEATGNLSNDLERSILLEQKRLAYEGIAQILQGSVSRLEELVELRLRSDGVGEQQSADPFFSMPALPKLTPASILRPPFMKLVLGEAIRDELVSDADNSREVAKLLLGSQRQPVPAWADPTIKLQARIGQGLTSGIGVVSSVWQMIRENLPEGADFYQIASAPQTMRTLVSIARAWEISELDDKMLTLGAEYDDAAQLVMPMSPGNLNPSFFTISENGVRIKRDGNDVFSTDYLDTRKKCPVAHITTEVDEEGHVHPITPIQQYAQIFLQAAQRLEKNEV